MKCEGVGQTVESSIDLSKSKVTNLEKPKNNSRFMITDNIGIEMIIAPTLKIQETYDHRMSTRCSNDQDLYQTMYTTDGDIYEPEQLDEGELDNFINSMNTGQFWRNGFLRTLAKRFGRSNRCPSL